MFLSFRYISVSLSPSSPVLCVAEQQRRQEWESPTSRFSTHIRVLLGAAVVRSLRLFCPSNSCVTHLNPPHTDTQKKGYQHHLINRTRSLHKREDTNIWQCNMPEGGALTAPKLIQAVGIALVLCYVAVNRARRDRRPANKGSRQQRQAKDLKRKRPGIQNQVCEGLADLIQDQAASPEEEQAGPLMTRGELAQGLLVVVVIGPASTKVYQVRVCVREKSCWGGLILIPVCFGK